MSETTQLSKFRQKRLRTLNKIKPAKGKALNSYFYPKNNLYTRQEFELLDSIYSDEPSSIAAKTAQEQAEDFWPQNKEEYLSISRQKGNLFLKLSWFTSGVMLTSVVWLIYFQLNIHEIKAKHDTQIVFQKSAQIVTDKTVDKEVTKSLEGNKLAQLGLNKEQRKPFINWVVNLPKKKEVLMSVPKEVVAIRYHTVGSGDSLWTIANKYYSNPSQENMNKIMRANSMRRVGFLSIGQKLLIPT